MNEPPAGLRHLLLWLLLIGLAGLAAELTLLGHYEDTSMVLPFVAMAVAAGGATARLARPSATSVRWLRASMLPMMAAGAAGAYLHFVGGREFQVDMDPTLSEWQLLWKVLHMQAPPMLAPAVLVQFALLGLVSTYRDPLTAASADEAARGARP
jgi:hypothetical protein